MATYVACYGERFTSFSETILDRMDYKYVLQKCQWQVVERRGSPEAIELTRYGGRRAFPFLYTCLWDIEFALREIFSAETDRKTPRPRFDEFVSYNEPQQGPLNAMIQAILEPLKVRVISKGHALEYYQVKSLQKALHRALRSLPAFELIGRKLKSKDLDRLKTFAKPDHQWGSIDYSAATDGSSSSLGLVILEYLCADLPIVDQQLSQQVLRPHQLFYPDCREVSPAESEWRGGEAQKEGKAPVGLQTNGQLMGSPLSFPVLCLMNFLVYCLNHPDQNSGESLNRVLVNGDDMLYTCSDEEWDNHIRLSKSVGLEMSPGKAYLHPVYANANSTSFHCNLRNTEPARQIGYLNTGLLFGKHKVMADDREDRSSEPIETVLNVITDGCIGDTMKQDILKMSLRLYKKDLRKNTEFQIVEPTQRGYRTRLAHRNLFLAQSAGGLGINSCGLKSYVTNDQKLLARERLEKVVESAGPKNVLLDLKDASVGEPDDAAGEWRLDSWCPWVTSRPADDKSLTLFCPTIQKLSQLRRDWQDMVKYYSVHGFHLIGNSSSAVWLC